ncbi:MAG: rod-binding protein [Rhodospirillaceae bacterium]
MDSFGLNTESLMSEALASGRAATRSQQAGALMALDGSKTMSVEEARQTAQDFEAMVIGQMLQPMFANLKSEAPFGGGHAEKTWRSLMVDEYGKMITKSGGLGIADQVMSAMLQTQEA